MPKIKYSTVQNWYPGDENGQGGIYNFVTKRAQAHQRQSQLDTGKKQALPLLGNTPAWF